MSVERAGDGIHGVLVVDKPAGPTSHDVVAKLRRALGTRAVGHAGTLDPAATGVLVVAIGEATKLVPYLTASDKAYLAGVGFGRATDTLDAAGSTVAEGPVAGALLDEIAALGAGGAEGGPIARAIAAELAREAQVPPAFSAIQQGGVRAHERARRGEEVELAPRAVRARRIEAVGHAGTTLMLELEVSKGYYVRALARDLGAALGVPTHLATLRRTRSGPFDLAGAVPVDAPRDALLGAMLPLADAAVRVLPSATLTDEGRARARHGKRLSAGDFASPPPAEMAAWLGPDGALVAIGAAEQGAWRVERGFQPTSSAAT